MKFSSGEKIHIAGVMIKVCFFEFLSSKVFLMS